MGRQSALHSTREMERQALAGIRIFAHFSWGIQTLFPEPLGLLVPQAWFILLAMSGLYRGVGVLGTSWGHQPHQDAPLLDLLPPRWAATHPAHLLEMEALALVGSARRAWRGAPVGLLNPSRKQIKPLVPGPAHPTTTPS